MLIVGAEALEMTSQRSRQRNYLCVHKKPPARDFSQPAAKVPCRQLMICAKLVALGDSFKPNEFSKCHETNEQKEAR
jgi:hypothetical protein